MITITKVDLKNPDIQAVQLTKENALDVVGLCGGRMCRFRYDNVLGATFQEEREDGSLVETPPDNWIVITCHGDKTYREILTDEEFHAKYKEVTG